MMTILERLQKEQKFVEETSVIINKLVDWQLERLATQHTPSQEMLKAELQNFTNLALQGKKDGISDGFLFYQQGRTAIEAFKFFQDIVPEFKKLK